MPARYTLQAIFTFGEFRLQAEEKEHLGQGECNHRKIDALAPDGEKSDDQPHEGGTHNAKKDTGFGGEAPFFN